MYIRAIRKVVGKTAEVLDVLCHQPLSLLKDADTGFSTLGHGILEQLSQDLYKYIQVAQLPRPSIVQMHHPDAPSSRLDATALTQVASSGYIPP